MKKLNLTTTKANKQEQTGKKTYKKQT